MNLINAKKKSDHIENVDSCIPCRRYPATRNGAGYQVGTNPGHHRKWWSQQPGKPGIDLSAEHVQTLKHQGDRGGRQPRGIHVEAERSCQCDCVCGWKCRINCAIFSQCLRPVNYHARRILSVVKQKAALLLQSGFLARKGRISNRFLEDLRL